MFAEVMMACGYLYQWKKNPTATKRELNCCTGSDKDSPENDRPLTKKEVKEYKDFLRKHAPPCYRLKFKDEKKSKQKTSKSTKQ